jgi:hypothetical protein
VEKWEEIFTCRPSDNKGVVPKMLLHLTFLVMLHTLHIKAKYSTWKVPFRGSLFKK